MFVGCILCKENMLFPVCVIINVVYFRVSTSAPWFMNLFRGWEGMETTWTRTRWKPLGQLVD